MKLVMKLLSQQVLVLFQLVAALVVESIVSWLLAEGRFPINVPCFINVSSLCEWQWRRFQGILFLLSLNDGITIMNVSTRGAVGGSSTSLLCWLFLIRGEPLSNHSIANRVRGAKLGYSEEDNWWPHLKMPWLTGFCLFNKVLPNRHF